MSCQVIGLLGLLALHSGCPRPPWGQKAACWAKTVPLRVLGGPEEAQYQSKVCGNHDSNTDGAASGSRDKIWSPGPSKDIKGHQKGHFGPKRALFLPVFDHFLGLGGSKLAVTAMYEQGVPLR